jgi:signal transduction histidine kinase
MFSSIKAKIIIFYTMVLVITLSILGFFLYFSLSNIVYNSIDKELLLKARSLGYLLKYNKRNINNISFHDYIKKATHNIVWQYDILKSEDYFQISRPDGIIIKKSHSLEKNSLPFYHEEQKISFKTILFNNKPIRIINFKIPNFVIQCGESIDFLQHYKIILFWAIIIILFISLSGGFLIAKKALSPIADISNIMNNISEINLSERVKIENISTELKILGQSFNKVLDRLEKFFTRQKEFITNASHELKTPLAVIRSHGEIILRKERTSQEYKNTLISILKSVDMMSEIINKLLFLAKIESENILLKSENMDLYKIIKESVKLLEPKAVQKEIKVDIDTLDEQQFILQGERGTLIELFTNIIDNAIKYNIPRGKVNIRIKKDGDFLITEIRDTGIGIPEKDLDKVFDRFYRVEMSHSKNIEGIGLGLSIAKQIVENYKGKIEITSRLNMGTTVIVYLISI